MLRLGTQRCAPRTGDEVLPNAAPAFSHGETGSTRVTARATFWGLNAPPGTEHDLVSKYLEDTKMVEGYCVKDKKMVEIKNPAKIIMKNGKPATQGTCPVCGSKVTRIGS